MKDLVVVGIDPGLANFGLSAAKLGKQTLDPILMEVLTTDKSNAKQKVLASDDMDRRANGLAKEFQLYLLRLEQIGQIVAFCIEATSFPRSSSAAAKTALSRGIVVGEAARRDIPLIACTPQEIKNHICGKKNASKKEVEAAICKKYPGIEDLISVKAKTKHEHCYDAMGAIDLGIISTAISAVRRLI